MRSDEINELAAALVLAQGEFESVAKSSTNPFFKSKYAGLPEVVKYASPILAKNGLAVSQFISTGYPTEDANHPPLDTLVTYLIHKSGQFMSDTMLLKLTKDDAQGQGSAITYARRYAYMAVLGLVADVDDDGELAVRGGLRAPMTASQKRMQGIGPAEAGKIVAGPIPTPATVNAERIHNETITRLGGVLQLKGISDKKMRLDILEAMAKRDYDAGSLGEMNETEAQEMAHMLANVNTRQEDLLALVNVDTDEPF